MPTATPRRTRRSTSRSAAANAPWCGLPMPVRASPASLRPSSSASASARGAAWASACSWCAPRWRPRAERSPSSRANRARSSAWNGSRDRRGRSALLPIRTRSRRAMPPAVPDPLALLRVPGPVAAYPAEPSDDEIARQVGLGVDEVVRFDMNTLGVGPLPGAARGLASYPVARLVEYGDQSYLRLRAAISDVTGVPRHRIVPGAGADELIRLVTGMTAGPGDAVLVPTPTFPMFAVEARLAGAEVIELAPGAPGEREAVETIRSAALSRRARLVWLCSPNNPTGDAFPLAETEAVVADLPAIVVVDAVYQELAEASLGLAPEALSLLALQDRHPTLVVLRSLAKAYGLAGARVGYLVVPEPLAARFDASRLPLAIGGPSEAAAIGALEEPYVARERHRLMVGERRSLSEALSAQGWEVLPSVTNFVLARPPTDAAQLAEALLKRGLVLRSWPSGPLHEWLRITARAPHENERLLAALTEIAVQR